VSLDTSEENVIAALAITSVQHTPIQPNARFSYFESGGQSRQASRVKTRGGLDLAEACHLKRRCGLED
jgi:hypothetical protein